MGRVMAGRVADMTEGSLSKVTVDGRDVLVANIGGRYYATDDTCTHSGASLSEGKLDGENIVCGWHGAAFECKTGKLAAFPARIGDLKSYSVTVEDGGVFIEV